jgi:hypothetical protein
MIRLPLIPTLLVAAAVAVMIGLGVWQLERAEWKEGIIAAARAEGLAPHPHDCRIDAAPQVRAGRSRRGESGYRYIVACDPTLPLMVDVGWSKRPDALPRVVLDGTLQAVTEIGNDGLVVALDPVPPLSASRLPSVEDIPNNHLFYAAQWFFFAAAAAVMYGLALRRRGRPKVAPPDRAS